MGGKCFLYRMSGTCGLKIPIDDQPGGADVCEDNGLQCSLICLEPACGVAIFFDLQFATSGFVLK